MTLSFVLFSLIVAISMDLIPRTGAVLNASSSSSSTQRFLNSVQIQRLTWFLRCLGCSFPDIVRLRDKFRNPPLEHYEEIKQLSRFWRSQVPAHHAAGYGGPWIEQYWFNTFIDRPIEFWYPVVPIFAPWVDTNAASAYNKPYAERVFTPFKNAIRDDVLYFTVSQNDWGLPFEPDFRPFHNIITLSAGGHGNVPIPLIKGSIWDERRAAESPRDLLLSFHGKVWIGLRTKMMAIINNNTFLREALQASQSVDWHSAMFRSRFVLCPGGYGRSSYRLHEAIQAGAIPVYVYDDIPWVSYNLRWSNFSIVLHLSEVHTLEDRIKALTPDQEARMRATVRSLARPFFTYEGVMEQIEKFFNAPTSTALQCSRRYMTIYGWDRPTADICIPHGKNHSDCACRPNWTV